MSVINAPLTGPSGSACPRGERLRSEPLSDRMLPLHQTVQRLRAQRQPTTPATPGPACSCSLFSSPRVCGEGGEVGVWRERDLGSGEGGWGFAERWGGVWGCGGYSGWGFGGRGGGVLEGGGALHCCRGGKRQHSPHAAGNVRFGDHEHSDKRILL